MARFMLLEGGTQKDNNGIMPGNQFYTALVFWHTNQRIIRQSHHGSVAKENPDLGLPYGDHMLKIILSKSWEQIRYWQSLGINGQVHAVGRWDPGG